MSTMPAAWRIAEWEREEARLAPSWGAKYARSESPEPVATEGTLPACCDMPPELAAQYEELARSYNAQRDLDHSEIDAQAEVDAQREAHREHESSEAIHALRESTYIRHVKNRAGRIVSQEAADKANQSRAQLDEDSIEMGMKLESVERPAFGSGPQGWIVGAINGQIKPILNMRKRAFFPAAAAQKRAPMVNALELLLRRKEHRFDQFCTFTSGKRVPLIVATEGVEVRAAFKALHRRVSKLNAQPFMREYGARIIARFSEAGGFVDDTGKERRDDAGNWTVHPHTHCLIHFKRFLSKNDMRAWTKAVWNFWNDHWSIDGALDKVREACKYVVKPADQKRLSALELKALDTALFQLHRAQPLGMFREYIRYRREHVMKVAREYRAVRGAEESVPVVLSDWNARVKTRIPTDADRERIARRKRLAEKEAMLRAQSANGAAFGSETAVEQQSALIRWDAETRTESVVTAPASARKPIAPPPRTAPTRPRVPFKNRVVARLSPAPYFGRIAEPALLVWSDERPDWETIRKMPFVADIIAAAGPLVASAEAALAREKAGGLKVSVHTSPVSVRAESGPPPRTPVFPALQRPQAWQKPLLVEA